MKRLRWRFVWFVGLFFFPFLNILCSQEKCLECKYLTEHKQIQKHDFI